MEPQRSKWFRDLDPREQAQILHAMAYAKYHASAGAPGHGQFMLIAKLAQLLVVNDEGGGDV